MERYNEEQEKETKIPELKIKYYPRTKVVQRFDFKYDGLCSTHSMNAQLKDV